MFDEPRTSLSSFACSFQRLETYPNLAVQHDRATGPWGPQTNYRCKPIDMKRHQYINTSIHVKHVKHPRKLLFPRQLTHFLEKFDEVDAIQDANGDALRWDHKSTFAGWLLASSKKNTRPKRPTGSSTHKQDIMTVAWFRGARHDIKIRQYMSNIQGNWHTSLRNWMKLSRFQNANGAHLTRNKREQEYRSLAGFRHGKNNCPKQVARLLNKKQDMTVAWFRCARPTWYVVNSLNYTQSIGAWHSSAAGQTSDTMSMRAYRRLQSASKDMKQVKMRCHNWGEKNWK